MNYFYFWPIGCLFSLKDYLAKCYPFWNEKFRYKLNQNYFCKYEFFKWQDFHFLLMLFLAVYFKFSLYLKRK